MTTKDISNEIIYDLLKEMREDTREFKRETNARLINLENKIDGIRITWSSRLVGGILGTSAVTSAIVAYFITSIS